MRTEGNSHGWLDDTSLDSSDWHSPNTGDFVDILEWKSEWLKNWSLWWLNSIKSIKKNWSFVPSHILRSLEEIVTDPS